METYIGTKVVAAEPMARGAYNEFRGWKIPEDESPTDEGYVVNYSDDYTSWSPKEAFDSSYRALDNLTFGLAIEAMKMGYAVAREGWNGKGMFLYYVPQASHRATTGAAKRAFGDVVPHSAYIAMKTAQGNVVPWLASQTDMLAEDWSVLA